MNFKAVLFPGNLEEIFLFLFDLSDTIYYAVKEFKKTWTQIVKSVDDKKSTLMFKNMMNTKLYQQAKTKRTRDNKI